MAHLDVRFLLFVVWFHSTFLCFVFFLSTQEVSVWTNVYLDPSSGLSQDLFVVSFFSVSLSVGVTFAVGYLLYIQVNRSMEIIRFVAYRKPPCLHE